MSVKRLMIVLGTALGVSACSNFSATNLFSHYSQQTYPLYADVYFGHYQPAMQTVDSLGFGEYGDILDNLERGRIALLNDDAEKSLEWLTESDRSIKALQDKAVISLSENAQSLGGLIFNDNLKDFFPADYELGFLHLYLALAYIRSNQFEDALVEFRRANKVQEQAKKIRQAVLEHETDELNQQGISTDVGSVLAQYPPASDKLSAVQNGYLFFLSALMFEAGGDLNNAYIDYKRALAVNPDNQMVAESTIRCAKKLAMKQDIVQLTKRYGEVDTLQAGQSQVIIIQEQSLVDYMRGWHQGLMVFDANRQSVLLSLALPYYEPQRPLDFSPLKLNEQTLSANLLTDVNIMARNQLQEQISVIVFRQILRMIVKEQLRQEVSQGEPISSVLVNVWNTMTDQPDTRSWLMLPAQVYGSRQVVNAGPQVLTIGDKQYQFETKDQGTTMVWISRQGENSVAWHKQLGKL